MPSTQWKEHIAPGEKERFEGYAKQIEAIQKKRKTMQRGFHPKGLGGVRATFTVLPDLPEHARQGLFATPGTHEAWVRFSNGAIKRQDDRKGDVRGMVIKVFGVDGKKLYGDAHTQDFSMIQTPRLIFKNSDEFMWFVGAAQNPLLLLPRLFGRFGIGRTLKILGDLPKTILGPVHSLATTRFWSPMAVQCGPYAVRYSAKPIDPPSASKGGSPEYLSEDLVARLRKGPLKWEILLQFFESEEHTPIEDCTKAWDVPSVRVAVLELPRQEPDAKLAADIEAHSFNPWHALVEHKPLGDMMRARDPAYFASTTLRGATKEP